MNDEYSKHMNILVSVNEKFIMPLKVMLFSLKKHNNCKINVYLLHSNLSEKSIEGLNSFLKEKFIGKLTDIKVDSSYFDNWPLCLQCFSVEVYYRVLLYAFLPEEIDRILWLDADILIQSDITDFYNQNFEEKLIVACLDKNYNSDTLKKHKQNLGMDAADVYFNSGVILFNLKGIREKISPEYFPSIVNKHADKFIYPDQDLLNIGYSTTAKYNDWRLYNYVTSNTDKFHPELYDAKIIHFVSSIKPWHPSYRDEKKYNLFWARYKEAFNKDDRHNKLYRKFRIILNYGSDLIFKIKNNFSN